MGIELVRDKTKKDTYMCCTLLNIFKRGEFRKDHPLQRKSGRWARDTRDGFVATAIKHEDVDPIKICEQIKSDIVVLWLIDGIQRLTTLEGFRNGMFKLGNFVEDPIVYYRVARSNQDGEIVKNTDGSPLYRVCEFDLRGKSYKDLPIQLKESFDNFQIDVVKHLNCSDEEVGYHIRRYNRQTSMSVTEEGVTYMNDMAKYVKDIADNNRFFKDFGCYKEHEKKKSVLYRIVAESVMAMFYLDDWKKITKQMGSYLSIHATKKDFDILAENLNRLQHVITEETKELFNSKNSFIWFALFERFKKFGLEDQKFGLFLGAFKKILSSKKLDKYKISFDEFNLSKATKDKKVVIQKLDMLDELMREFFNIECPGASSMTNDDVDIFEFVRKEVDPSINEDDIDDYYSMLDEYDIEKTSKLLEWQNEPSLIAIIAYSFKNDIDLDDWIRTFFKNNNSYFVDQKRNYLDMKNDLIKYLQSTKKKAS